MTRDDASGFEQEAVAARAARIVGELQAAGLPMIAFEVFDCGHHVGFMFRYPNGKRWAFRVPRPLLNRENVEKMLRAYL